MRKTFNYWHYQKYKDIALLQQFVFLPINNRYFPTVLSYSRKPFLKQFSEFFLPLCWYL